MNDKPATFIQEDYRFVRCVITGVEDKVRAPIFIYIARHERVDPIIRLARAIVILEKRVSHTAFRGLKVEGDPVCFICLHPPITEQLTPSPHGINARRDTVRLAVAVHINEDWAALIERAPVAVFDNSAIRRGRETQQRASQYQVCEHIKLRRRPTPGITRRALNAISDKLSMKVTLFAVGCMPLLDFLSR